MTRDRTHDRDSTAASGALGEDRWTPILLIALLLTQLLFLGALYFKMTAIQGQLVGLQQTLAVAGAAGGSGGGAGGGRSVVEEVVPGVEAGDGPVKGAEGAPVTVVEFSDFSCSACRAAQPRLDQILEEAGGDVRLVYRHFPLRLDTDVFDAAVAAECAHRMDRFWPVHDLLFAHEGDFERSALVQYATEVGLDGEAFAACLDSREAADAVREDRARGQEWGVRGTPTFFINGRRLTGLPGATTFHTLIEQIRDEDGSPDRRAG